MDDGIGLFKLLVVLGVVLYQLVKILRKKSADALARQSAPEAETEVEEGGREDSWDPEPAPPKPVFQPSRPEAETVRERIRSLVLGRAQEPAAEVEAPRLGTAAVAEIPMATAIPTPVRAVATPHRAPALRDMVLAQVVLAPPPGLRGSPWGRRAGAFRP